MGGFSFSHSTYCTCPTHQRVLHSTALTELHVNKDVYYVVALLVGQSRDRFPVVSLDFSVIYTFRLHHGPGVDSAPSENEYQEHFLLVKATGAWGWQPHHLRVPNVMEICEPKPPGNHWVTPGLLRDCFTFFIKICVIHPVQFLFRLLYLYLYLLL